MWTCFTMNLVLLWHRFVSKVEGIWSFYFELFGCAVNISLEWENSLCCWTDYSWCISNRVYISAAWRSVSRVHIFSVCSGEASAVLFDRCDTGYSFMNRSVDRRIASYWQLLSVVFVLSVLLVHGTTDGHDDDYWQILSRPTNSSVAPGVEEESLGHRALDPCTAIKPP